MQGLSAAATAQSDLTLVYDFLATQPCLPLSGDLNGVTLFPGVYCVAAATSNLSGVLTLTGAGSHILRMASTLITSPGSLVQLAGRRHL